MTSTVFCGCGAFVAENVSPVDARVAMAAHRATDEHQAWERERAHELRAERDAR
jgi:hypothetical protein